MKKTIFLILPVLVLFACSTGKKAMEKGDYFSAVSKAVQRLQSNPKSKNAQSVVKESYPLAIQWSQDEIDLLLSGNEDFKWDKTYQLMQKVNNIASEIRLSPVAYSIISDPKIYTSELDMAKNKAAEERYVFGIAQLDENTLESARKAYRNFQRVGELVSGYKDVAEKIELSKQMGTLKVILEAIPVHTKRYQLSSEFFYGEVFKYLNDTYPPKSFVNVFSPDQAERLGIEYPDFVANLQFYDFEVGRSEHSEKEETLTKRVKVENRDTSKVSYHTYKAKLKTLTDKAKSRGILEVQVIDFENGEVVMNERIPGEFIWMNTYAIYVGDEKALTNEQLKLTKGKVLPLPSTQDMFVEFTKPIYDQLTQKLRRFFNKYD